jgi:hypothetical protein
MELDQFERLSDKAQARVLASAAEYQWRPSGWAAEKGEPVTDDELRDRLAATLAATFNTRLAELSTKYGLPDDGRLTPADFVWEVDAVLPLVRAEIAAAQISGRDEGLDDAYVYATSEGARTFAPDGENTPATDACLRIAKRIREAHSQHAANVEARAAVPAPTGDNP